MNLHMTEAEVRAMAIDAFLDIYDMYRERGDDHETAKQHAFLAQNAVLRQNGHATS